MVGRRLGMSISNFLRGTTPSCCEVTEQRLPCVPWVGGHLMVHLRQSPSHRADLVQTPLVFSARAGHHRPPPEPSGSRRRPPPRRSGPVYFPSSNADRPQKIRGAGGGVPRCERMCCPIPFVACYISELISCC